MYKAFIVYAFFISYSRTLRLLALKQNNYRRSNCNYRFISIRTHLTTHIHVVGKKTGGEQFILDGIQEYEKRLSSTIIINTYFNKSDEELIKSVTDQKYKIMCMDENGIEHTSREFHKILYSSFEESGANVGFVIGGFNGLPQILRSKYPLISLSRMTWTHQMARLLLVEQIYRASEIAKGSKYHKS
jgi:23S rRNA (pseudouridine1915-N3)-methyltransferase